MNIPRPSENTKRLREMAAEQRRRLDTVPEIPPPRRSMPQVAADKWTGSPSWAKGVVIIIATIAASSAAIIQIIQAFK